MSGQSAFKFDVRGDFGSALDVPGGILRLGEACERSELTPEDAAEIARDIDQAIWERVRHDYEEA